MSFDLALRETARTVEPETDASVSQTGDVLTQKDRVLHGLVQRGHCLDAISTFLRVEREEVLDRVVRLDLATPHDRPMRHRSGARAWAAGDYFRFIECWMSGWHATS